MEGSLGGGPRGMRCADDRCKANSFLVQEAITTSRQAGQGPDGTVSDGSQGKGTERQWVNLNELMLISGIF